MTTQEVKDAFAQSVATYVGLAVRSEIDVELSEKRGAYKRRLKAALRGVWSAAQGVVDAMGQPEVEPEAKPEVSSGSVQQVEKL